MDKKSIIQILVKFVEGNISFKEFRDHIESDDSILSLLEDKNPNQDFPYQKNKTIKECLFFYRWESSAGRLNVHKYILRYLDFYKVANVPTPIYQDDWRFRIEIQPSYVNIRDDEYLDRIICSAPKELSQAQRKKWLKDKIKNLFKYETKPPRWIQDPEWPIVEGIPLVFKSQSKEKTNDERVLYQFYNPINNEEMVIVQFY